MAAQAACTGRPDSRLLGARARAKRTRNISAMTVTLEVSKLSGWLNLYACCQVKGRACDAGRGARREAGQGVRRRRRKRHARGKADSRLSGARAREGRTRNMEYMLVTLDVSKLSGWLNACADCRVEGRGTCDAGRGCGPGGGRVWGGGGASGMLGVGPTQGCWGPGHARGARTSRSCP